VVTHTNVLKKRVLNEMIANLPDEVRLHPDEMLNEAAACGGAPGEQMTDFERVCVVANH
jgi:hypothetical protein